MRIHPLIKAPRSSLSLSLPLSPILQYCTQSTEYGSLLDTVGSPIACPQVFQDDHIQFLLLSNETLLPKYLVESQSLLLYLSCSLYLPHTHKQSHFTEIDQHKDGPRDWSETIDVELELERLWQFGRAINSGDFAKNLATEGACPHQTRSTLEEG